jgi:glycosyltransferase involved in cell wall biosynthesis
MARVSVVVPFHNAEQYLAEAIASVRAQTFEDWELLLVNDASSDTSPQIALAASVADPRIRLLTAGAGTPVRAAAARNRGIEAASGEFVTFLDADDLYLPEKLARDIELLDRHPDVAMVYGPTEWFWDDANSASVKRENMRREAGVTHDPGSLLSPVLLWNEWQVPCTCSVALRRADLLAAGGFEEQFALYEDQTLWAKVFASFAVYVHGDTLARYRQHPRSSSAMAAAAGQYQFSGAHPARAKFLDWLAGYLALTRPGDERLAKEVAMVRAPYLPGGPARLAGMVRFTIRKTGKRLQRRADGLYHRIRGRRANV